MTLVSPVAQRIVLPVTVALILCLLTCSTIASAAQSAVAPHITRSAQTFKQLEEALQQALHDANVSQLDAMLGEEFQMIAAQDPGTVTPRDEWIAGMHQAGATAYAVERMSVREIGAVAIASFVLRPTSARTGALPISVVDVWERGDTTWVLTTRHAAPLKGPRCAVPGETKTAPMRKQI